MMVQVVVTVAVRVFSRHSTSPLGWIQVGMDLDGEASRDAAGLSVAISASGHVWVFERVPTPFGWNQIGQDLDGAAARNDNFGVSVALSSDGNVLAVGGHGNDNNGGESGHSQVYKRDDTSPLGWIQVGDDVDGEASYDHSGLSVALSANGHVLAVGASVNNNVNGNGAGYVRVFETCMNVS